MDDLLDEMLRVNFNVTLPSAPCDYLSVDVSDLAGGARHNITKDILKWRLNSHGELLGSSLAVSVVDTPGAEHASGTATTPRTRLLLMSNSTTTTSRQTRT